ncbi:efflux RND transporter periplasmic adaptor subunit [Aquabacterium sp. J223]|uniref:efflux RND transporter periplasmic adaptor subunit n=1 Tax=Aquabacterium sp. J223 TaxID=2898431 RepID=UPI0021AD640A|nr:efflux RND transporter periplasmic adaptor subunit [Aquabacterium sp. J223]UUX95429.1 efflux RND transporter periplasmic adaptor subunit [Aquabacterium sp. J223]
MSRAGQGHRAIAAAALAAWAGLSGTASAGEFDCVIEPRMTVDVRPASEGLVEQVLVDRGDRIRAGQVLVVLDSGVERATLEQSRYRASMVGAVRSGESRVEYAALKLGRRETLAKDDFVSPQDRDEAAAEKRLAEAELLQARENKRAAELEQQRNAEQLRLRTLKSPFNGVVVERQVHPGDFADSRDTKKPLLRIADISLLHVEVLLPVAAYGKVQPGATIAVMPEAPIGGRHTARVKTLDPVADVASGTVRARLELPNPDLKLPAGITCKADFPGLERGAAGLAARRSGPAAAPSSAARPEAAPAVQGAAAR